MLNWARISSVTSSTGQIAPIPPVFGPFAPSRSLLWSRALMKGTMHDFPAAVSSGFTDTAPRIEISTPRIYSSMTSLRPASPTSWPSISSSTALSASSMLRATTTPFPAARPSALRTIGAPCSFTYARAASLSVNVLLSAQATPYLCMKFFAKSLLPSSCAGSFFVPTVGIPSDQNLSARPAQRGSSGPTTQRSHPFSFAILIKSSWDLPSTLRHLFSKAVPPLPGVQITSSTELLCASFQAMACSRPPFPTTITFMPL